MFGSMYFLQSCFKLMSSASLLLIMKYQINLHYLNFDHFEIHFIMSCCFAKNLKCLKFPLNYQLWHFINLQFKLKYSMKYLSLCCFNYLCHYLSSKHFTKHFIRCYYFIKNFHFLYYLKMNQLKNLLVMSNFYLHLSLYFDYFLFMNCFYCYCYFYYCYYFFKAIFLIHFYYYLCYFYYFVN